MNFPKTRLGNIADFNNGVNFNQTSYKQGVKLIGVSDFGERFSPNIDSLAEIDKNVVADNALLKNGDIVFVRSNGNKALVGRCMLIKEVEQPVTFSGFCIRARFKNLDQLAPEFFAYYFKSQYFRKSISGSSVGTNIQNLNQSILKNTVVPLPDFDVQKRISKILSSYDDLIENNQKQIKLLEEAAQRLYKEWFVDLRFPGYEQAKIIDGVPEGWKWRSVKDVIAFHDAKRKPLSSMERNSFKGKYRYFGAAGVLDYVAGYLFDGIYLLLGEDGTVITSDGYPVLQYVDGKFWVNNHAHILTGKNPFTTEYIFMMFKNLKVTDVVTGVAQPKISQERLCKKKIIVPSLQLVESYQTLCKPFFEKILTLQQQITLLAEARDRLLPKLMNGEIEV